MEQDSAYTPPDIGKLLLRILALFLIIFFGIAIFARLRTAKTEHKITGALLSSSTTNEKSKSMYKSWGSASDQSSGAHYQKAVSLIRRDESKINSLVNQVSPYSGQTQVIKPVEPRSSMKISYSEPKKIREVNYNQDLPAIQQKYSQNKEVVSEHLVQDQEGLSISREPSVNYWNSIEDRENAFRETKQAIVNLGDTFKAQASDIKQIVEDLQKIKGSDSR